MGGVQKGEKNRERVRKKRAVFPDAVGIKWKGAGRHWTVLIAKRACAIGAIGAVVSIPLRQDARGAIGLIGRPVPLFLPCFAPES